MTRLLTYLAYAVAAARVALLTGIGRRPAAYSRYKGRHWSRREIKPFGSKLTLAARMKSIGIQKPVAPDPDEPTLPLGLNGVQALGHLSARQHAKAATDETGIGILRPVVEGDEDGMCTATHMPDGYRFEVECEQRVDKHDPATCSALGGTVTWPRNEMAVA